MKIGIISINAHTKVLNFASPLHSYAFWAFLERNGIESTIIDYIPNYYGKFDVKHPLFYYIDYPKSSNAAQKRLLKRWKTLFYEREDRYEHFEKFIQTYYRKTDKCYTAKLMDTEDPGFDCYICATDVIWKCNLSAGFDRGFFLACKQLEGKKKIAYSASRGAREYTPKQAKEFFDYISDIDFISVREKSLQNYIQQNSDLPVTQVLDPVFLNDRDFYIELASPPEKKGYVLIYIVMEKATELVETAAAYAASHNLELLEISEDLENADIPEGTHHEIIYGIGIEDWLGYMKDATCIFTNSFHACCFSIIFGVQFFAGNRSGDKIGSLLDMFHLSHRYITGVSTETVFNMPDINYDEIDTLRHQLASESSSFILNAIHHMERNEHQNHRDLVHESVYSAKDEDPPAKQNNKKTFLSRLKTKIKQLLKQLKKFFHVDSGK